MSCSTNVSMPEEAPKTSKPRVYRCAGGWDARATPGWLVDPAVSEKKPRQSEAISQLGAM